MTASKANWIGLFAIATLGVTLLAPTHADAQIQIGVNGPRGGFNIYLPQRQHAGYYNTHRDYGYGHGHNHERSYQRYNTAQYFSNRQRDYHYHGGRDYGYQPRFGAYRNSYNHNHYYNDYRYYRRDCD